MSDSVSAGEMTIEKQRFGPITEMMFSKSEDSRLVIKMRKGREGSVLMSMSESRSGVSTHSSRASIIQ
jgi:hypothetical protein